MGCCQSTPDEDASTSVLQQDVANARVLQAAPEPLSRSISSIDSRRQSHDVLPPKLTGVGRPNKAIRAPSPLRSSPSHLPNQPPPWTRAQLNNERTAFFDTRVTGRAEVWNALRLVCSLLQQGNTSEAQGIMDALDVTCPQGRVAAGRGRDRAKGGVYDQFGELYELPAWVVTDPRDIVDEEKSFDETEPSAEDRLETESNREEKGKGRAADLGEVVQLRARMSDRGTDVVITIGKKEKVAAAVRKIQEQIGMRRVRLVYLGHVLQETKTLESQGYRTGDVLNAYVFEGPDDFFQKQRTV
ncbi:hypothetical protein AMS68_007591 [Peltaster fructicola]|uniref:Ubiquitin-like domain-containing protein n=1 Tax=Peltaster fructicola TaxID=286661 RepID=A0A6H0Y4Y2_9PEZI|nr:hypothetical protein AMS68_007591 [Peltaster fructicola]